MNSLNSLADLVAKGPGPGHEDEQTTLASKLAYWRSTTYAGQAFDVLDVVVSVISVGFYIDYTYLLHPAGSYGRAGDLPAWSEPIEVAFAALFAVHFLLNFLSAKQWREHVTKVSTLVDVLTIMPVVVAGVIHEVPLWAQGLKCLRMLRLTHTYALSRLFKTEIQQQLFSIGFTITNLVIIWAAFLQLVENARDWWPTDWDVDSKQ